jgi:hypothetical protein
MLWAAYVLLPSRATAVPLPVPEIVLHSCSLKLLPSLAAASWLLLTANTSDGFFSPADSVMARLSMNICTATHTEHVRNSASTQLA